MYYKTHDVSETESDDSEDFLTTELKKLIECDGQQKQKNVLNGYIKPPKFRPSVVHRAFKKKVTSTPLAVKGINNCSASDPSLSPIRNNESVASGSKKKDNFIPESQTAIRTRKSGQSTDSLNNTYLKNNECDTDINHDKSKSNNKIIINEDKDNFVNSKNNVPIETPTQDDKKSGSSRFSKRSSNNNLSNNLLDNGKTSEVTNDNKSTTPKKTSIGTRKSIGNSLHDSKTNKVRNASPEKDDVEHLSSDHATQKKQSNNDITNKNASPKRTSINTSKSNRNSLPDNNLVGTSPVTEVEKTSSPDYSLRTRHSSNLISKNPSLVTTPTLQKNKESFDAILKKISTPNQKNSLSSTHKSRYSLRSLTPQNDKLNFNKTPDNNKRNTVSGGSAKNTVGKSTGKSLLPVPISRDIKSKSWDRKSIEHPSQLQNKDGEYVENNNNNKQRSKSVDFIEKNVQPNRKEISQTAIDNVELHTNREGSIDTTEIINKQTPPVPKPRNKKNVEVGTNTDDIHVSKSNQVDAATNRTFSSCSSDSVNKQKRLAKFIDKLVEKKLSTTESSPSNSKTVLNRSVQTSYRKSISLNKPSNCLQEQPINREMQTQTSYKDAPNRNNSSDGTISNYTGLIEYCADVNLYDSLKPADIVDRFSSSTYDYALLENSNKPWRVDENLNLPTRSSIHLSFIKSSSCIEAQKEAIKRLKRYSKAPPKERKSSTSKQIDSDESLIEFSDCSDQGVDKTLMNPVKTAKSTEDDNESLGSSFRLHVRANSVEKIVESSSVAEDVPIEDEPIKDVPNDQLIETAITNISIAEKHVSNDPVSEWVANVNSEFRNTEDESESCFFENGLCPTHSPRKALFQDETKNSKKKKKNLCVMLDRVDTLTHNNKENGRPDKISDQFADLATRLDATEKDDHNKKIEDKSDGLFKVPMTKKAPRSDRSKKSKKSTLAPPEPLIDTTCEGDITGLRRSSRTRRAPSRKYFPVIILNDVSKSEQKFWTGLVCDSKYENYSTITTSSSIIKTNMKRNQRQATSGNGRKSVQFSIHEKDIDHHKKSINKRKSKKKESVDGSLDKSKPKKKRGKYSVANDPAEATSTVPNDQKTNELEQPEIPNNEMEQPEILNNFHNDHQFGAEEELNQPPATPVHNASIANKSPPNNNTKTRKYRSKTFLANDVAETNTSMGNYSQSNEREQAAISDTQVDTNKKPKQLAVVNEREMNHDSYQYSKTANSSKYISSDSGRSTLMKSSIDENIKTGRICKGTRKRKVARSVQNRPKSLANKVDEVAKDTNNVDGIDGKYIEVYSESGIHKLKYSEENPKFNQHCDNLKYSDPLDHINGASMVHLEIPPGEIKRKHTNKKHNLFYVVIEGRGRVFVQDEVCGLKKKSGFLIPTGLCYSIVNDSSDETLSLTCVKMPI